MQTDRQETGSILRGSWLWRVRTSHACGRRPFDSTNPARSAYIKTRR